MKKSEKAYFLELQVRQEISQTLFELETSGLAYSARYDQYLIILLYLWLKVKSKLFTRVKNVKK